MAEIKETKEALVGALELTSFLVEKLKDGVQFADFTELFAKITSDEGFKNKLQSAYDGVQAIPEELKDISIGELFELVQVIIPYVGKLTGAKA